MFQIKITYLIEPVFQFTLLNFHIFDGLVFLFELVHCRIKFFLSFLELGLIFLFVARLEGLTCLTQ